MLAAFFYSAKLYFTLCLQSLGRRRNLGQLTWRGRLLRLAVYVLIFPIWLLHWLCLFLDEILFFSYHLQEIKRPLFILGVPRSGTTFLHRTIAADKERFTSVSTWEALLAPSILQKKLALLLIWIDGRIGNPAAKILRWLETRLFTSLQGVHDVALDAAEEDYLLLLPLFSCFILFLPFTESEHVWSLSRFDWQAAEKDKKRIMNFYRACLQKHLYVFARGENSNKRYLSKNAAFASWPVTLHDYFPDAEFVICMREPDKAVPSLLGSLQSGADFFELSLQAGELPEMLVAMMADYYEHLLHRFPVAAPIVHMETLQNNIGASVEAIYRFHGDQMSDDYRQRLLELNSEARRYQTRTQAIKPDNEADHNFYTERFMQYYQQAEAIKSDLNSRAASTESHVSTA